MPIFSLQFPSVLVRVLHVIRTHFFENFLQIGYGLVCDFNKILNVVVLMLLEGIEKHVHHSILVVTSFLALGLLLLEVFDLKFEWGC
jgi:hypothetical protein